MVIQLILLELVFIQVLHLYTLKPMILFKKTVMAINEQCNVPVFIGEFSYPSGEMSGDFAGWNKEVGGYPHTKEGQAAIYKDVVNWGINRGVKSIRY